MQWIAAGATDAGRRRTANEDSYLVRADRGVFVVADGMGGHAAGEVASRIAVETIDAHTEDTGREPGGAAAVGERLVAATEAANREILAHGERHPETSGMGTTSTTLALIPAERAFVIAHVGDSRAYRFRNGTLDQLTTDHTWVNQQVELGLLTPEQARRHRLASVLTRGLGVAPSVEVDTISGAVEPNDLLLLCSDGLTGPVDERDLSAMLATGDAPDEQVRRLLEAANLRGGPDNITAVLIRAAA